MADQVTISTFLELRDNLSEGMRKAAAAVEGTIGRVRKARSDEEKATEKSAAAQIKAMKAVDASLKERERTREKTQAALRRSAEQAALAEVNAQKAKDAESRRANADRVRQAITNEKANERAAARARADMDRAAENAEKMRHRKEERAAKERKNIEARAAREMRLAAERSARDRLRIEQQVTSAMERAEARRLASARRALAQHDREIARAQAQAQRQASGGGDGKVFGLFAPMVAANLVAGGISRAAGFAIDTTTDIVKKAIEVNVEYEKSISAISSAMYTMDISPSMEVAETYTKGVIDILRMYAAKLPGEAAEYVEVFQRTIPAALRSGMTDSKKYAEFVSKYTAVAIQRGVGAKVAASNLQLILQGTARHGTKMMELLLGYTNKTKDQINAMTREARFDLLQKAIEDASSGMGAAASKADAIFGELQTRIEDIYRIGGEPLFEAAKESAKDLNAWLEINKTSINDIAAGISQTLGYALTGAISLAKELANAIMQAVSASGATKTPQSRLAELKGPKGTFSRLFEETLTTISPFAGAGYSLATATMKIGEIKSLEKDIKKTEEEKKRLAGIAAIMEPKEAALGLKLKAGDTAAQMTDTIAAMMKKGAFNIPGKPMKNAVAEYIESRLAGTMDVKARRERAQEIWQELIGRDIVKPGKGLADTAPRGAPSVRPEQTFDFRHSRFDIKQEFAEGFDPDRIAVAFANDLGRLGDMKLQASYGLAGGVR